ncbi:membrane protein [Streptococcus suis]|nr:membrane protein [Streptococcus suis]
MFALGTIINTVAIALAGLLGSWFGHLLKERNGGERASCLISRNFR